MSYHANLEAVIQDFLDLESKYPRKVSHETIGKSWEGRDIYLFKIGNPYGSRVMFIGTTHGGEWVGTEVYCLFAHWLLENHEPGISDKILQRNYILIVPSLNVDGYNRKSRCNRNPSGGVNLNRNFPKSWRTDCTILGTPDPTTGACPEGQIKIGNYCYKSNCACGWSDTPGAGDYRGVAPASEPETQAMLSAFQKWKPKFVLDYHTWDPNRELIRPSARAGLTSEAKSYHDYIYQKISQLMAERNAPTPYPVYYQAGVCGPLIDDGYATGGATSFLLEGLSKDDCGGYVNPPYSMITDIAYPQFLCVAITMCQESWVLGTLTCKSTADSQEVSIPVEIVDIGTYTTPFSIDLPPGTYTLKATYNGQTIQKTFTINEGTISQVTLPFQKPQLTGPLGIWTFPVVSWIGTLFPTVKTKAETIIADIKRRWKISG
jgi:hypothetical protein